MCRTPWRNEGNKGGVERKSKTDHSLVALKFVATFHPSGERAESGRWALPVESSYLQKVLFELFQEENAKLDPTSHFKVVLEKSST